MGLTGLLALGAGGQADAQVIGDDLKVLLSLDNQTGGVWADASGRNNVGTSVGTPTVAPGKIGGSALIDYDVGGSINNYITLGYPNDLLFGATTDFSISFWTKFTSFNGDPSFISNKNWVSGSNSGFVLATNGDRSFQWNYREGLNNGETGQGNTPGTGRRDYDGPPSTFQPDQWVHVATVFDRDGFGFTYINGLLVNGTPVNQGIASIDTNNLTNGGGDPLPRQINIGQDGTGLYNDGGNAVVWTDLQMDDVAIWSRRLAASEVATIYEAGNAATPQGLSTLLNTPRGPFLPPPAPNPIPVDNGNNPGSVILAPMRGGVNWEVGITNSLNTGYGGSPLAQTGPAFTIYEGELGTTSAVGRQFTGSQGDAFDRAMVVSVNTGEPGNTDFAEGVQARNLGFTIPESRGGSITTGADGSKIIAGDAYTMNNGLTAQLTYTLNDQQPIIRQFVTLTNNTGAAKNDVLINLQNAMGIDSGGYVVLSSDGFTGVPDDFSLTGTSRWVITNDENDAGLSDPAAISALAGPGGTQFGDAGGGRTGELTYVQLQGGPKDNLLAGFRTNIPNGQTVRVMFLTMLTPTGESAVAVTETGLFNNIAALSNAGLLEGIPAGTQIVNWGAVPNPNQYAASGGAAWGDASTWTGAVPNASTHLARLGASLTSNGTVDLQGTDRKVLGLSFNNTAASYTIGATGAGKLIIEPYAGIGHIRFEAGNTKDHAISAPLTLEADLDVWAGSNTLALTGAQQWNDHEVTVQSGTLRVAAVPAAGKVNVAKNAKFSADALRLDTLNIEGVGSVAAAAVNGGPAGLAVLNNLSIGNDAKLDLNDNDLVLYYTGTSPLESIQAQIVNGLGASAGTAQIASTHAQSLVGPGEFPITLHVPIDNAGLGATEWLGTPLTGANQIIAKYTYFGDLNLDGMVDAGDYIVIDNNFGRGAPGDQRPKPIGPFDGDADLSGVVDAGDYIFVDNAFGFGSGSGPRPNPLAGSDVAAVPEPATWTLLGIGSALALLRGWRSRRKA